MLKGKFVRLYQFIFSYQIWKEWQNNIKIFSTDSKKVKIKKIYFIICLKYKKFKNCKRSHIFDKTVALLIISSECSNEDKKIFKEVKSIKILKILGLIINAEGYWKNI